eukprot:PITA_02968
MDLYGLKQAPRAWYTKIDSYFISLGFTKSEAVVNLYHIMVKGKPLIIFLYVDDLILTGDDQLIQSCKEDLAREFEMKDMGLVHYSLGMETPLVGNWRKEDATSGEVVAAIVYPQLMGSLMYLVNTRPDLCFAVNQLSQAMVQPTKMFWKAAKHVMRYLRGTSQFGLWYRQTKGVKL